MKLDEIRVENPENKYQVVIGQGNFSVLTVDDLFRALLTAAPGIKCAVAMNEAEPKLTRVTGNDSDLKELAGKNALKIAASHVFVIFLSNVFPINVLNTIKMHPAVCNIFVGSANPIDVIVAETELGRAVLGAVDGQSIEKIENAEQKKERRDLLGILGYKLD